MSDTASTPTHPSSRWDAARFEPSWLQFKVVMGVALLSALLLLRHAIGKLGWLSVHPSLASRLKRLQKMGAHVDPEALEDASTSKQQLMMPGGVSVRRRCRGVHCVGNPPGRQFSGAARNTGSLRRRHRQRYRDRPHRWRHA